MISNILYGSLEGRKSCIQVYLRSFMGENRIETLLEKRNKLYIHPQKLPKICGWKKEPINVNLTWMWDHQLKIMSDFRLSFHPSLAAVPSPLKREQGEAAAIFVLRCLILPSWLPGNLHNLLAGIDPKD